MSFLSDKHHDKLIKGSTLFFKITVLLTLVVFFASASADFTSTNFKLENPIVILGGGQSSSSNFTYLSSTGQLVSGQSTSASFLQNAGFLYFPVSISVTPPPGLGSGGGGHGAMTPPGLTVDCRVADFNCDGNVNVFDLSILLYYLKKPNAGIAPYDLNHDGQMNLADVSILFYHWDR